MVSMISVSPPTSQRSPQPGRIRIDLVRLARRAARCRNVPGLLVEDHEVALVLNDLELVTERRTNRAEAAACSPTCDPYPSGPRCTRVLLSSWLQTADLRGLLAPLQRSRASRPPTTTAKAKDTGKIRLPLWRAPAIPFDAAAAAARSDGWLCPRRPLR
jgi:hypothetical protein